jgi:lipopolysaccharide assembly outer membrane protein LptD (OstA)
MSKCKRFVLGPPTLRFGFFLALVLIIQAFPSRAGQAWEPVSRFVTTADTSIVPQLSLSDSIPPLDSLRSENVVLPPDSAEDIEFINASIFYDARDTIVLDAAENKVRLYGNAVVKYETMVLSADYIEYSFTNNEACAAGVPDSLGVLQGKPVFDDNGQSFTQEYLCYNFRTKKGFSRNSVTKEGDAVFHAAQSKRHTNEWVHIKGGKFTTCDADNPHFHFHLSKAIIVPDE